MATAAPFYRVPVVIFAVLVGGLFVYAKAGGQFGSRPRVTPATNANGEELAPPQIEYMMGSKSAPAFAQPPARSTVYAKPAAKKSVARQPAPQQPTNAAPPQLRMMPGSKSAILVDPATLAPAPQPRVTNAPPQNYSQPRNVAPNNIGPTNIGPSNAAPPRARSLPGSKSMIVIPPEALQPAPQYNQNTNAPPRQQQQLQLPANQVQRPSNQVQFPARQPRNAP
jgi:hypothetical protein